MANAATSLCLTILSPRTQPQPLPPHDLLKNCTSSSASDTLHSQEGLDVAEAASFAIPALHPLSTP
ncbi:hypothetical protein CVT25_011956 [Psilocybe cyanescens]|uniref:Uncharacterized protein n=1 Tax=Psilocybe cyanescens TaxID=93625 RepID=A0A409XK33_PSICY|nr:hypothetical protein CVT25_011956 [Psilocybe cyanescens]